MRCASRADERSAIEAVMRAVGPPEYPSSPMTGVVMDSGRLLPNRCGLRQRLQICNT